MNELGIRKLPRDEDDDEPDFEKVRVSQIVKHLVSQSYKIELPGSAGVAIVGGSKSL